MESATIDMSGALALSDAAGVPRLVAGALLTACAAGMSEGLAARTAG